MPLAFRDLKKEIELHGYSLEITRNGHYWVLTPNGGKLITFAVNHRKNAHGEVFDSYVGKVRKAIKADQS